MPRKIEIGFDRYFKRAWMDYCFNLMASGTDPKQVRELFLESLIKDLPGKDARRKTFTVINRIWVSPLKELEHLRDDALKEKPDMIVHWVMCMAAYPFFSAVAETVGRLSSLNEMVHKRQIVKRLYEKYGDREIVERAGRHVLRTFVELGVLNSIERGVYQKKQQNPDKEQACIASYRRSDNQNKFKKNYAGEGNYSKFCSVSLPVRSIVL